MGCLWEAASVHNLTSRTYYQSLDVGYSPPADGDSRWGRHLRPCRRAEMPRRARIFEKEVTWSNRWHDFYTKLIVRVRPGAWGEITGRTSASAADPITPGAMIGRRVVSRTQEGRRDSVKAGTFSGPSIV